MSLNGNFSYKNLAFRLIWVCASAWAGKGKAVSGSQLISQSNNIYRILHVRGSMQTQWEIQRRVSVHEKPGLVSLGGKVCMCYQKDSTRHCFDWAVCLMNANNEYEQAVILGLWTFTPGHGVSIFKAAMNAVFYNWVGWVDRTLVDPYHWAQDNLGEKIWGMRSISFQKWFHRDCACILWRGLFKSKGVIIKLCRGTYVTKKLLIPSKIFILKKPLNMDLRKPFTMLEE